MDPADPPVMPPEEDTYPEVAIERGPRRRWILSYAKAGGVGAEFGVFRGHFAAEIADCLKPAKLYLVDPWTKSGDRFDWGDMPDTNFNRLTTAQALNDARARMEPFRQHTEIEFVEDFSYAFCERLSSPLDFAYIDTDHVYESTLAELEAVARVVADDGVIMGDDWITDPTHRHAGVLRAVNDFLRCRNFELLAAGPEAQWCIRRTPRYSTPRHWLKAPLGPPWENPAGELGDLPTDRVARLRRRVSQSPLGPPLRRGRAILRRGRAALQRA